MKVESGAEKRFDEILRRTLNAKPLSRRRSVPGSVPEESPRTQSIDLIFGYTFGYRHQFALIYGKLR
jgi:hypothetical protein